MPVRKEDNINTETEPIIYVLVVFEGQEMQYIIGWKYALAAIHPIMNKANTC